MTTLSPLWCQDPLHMSPSSLLSTWHVFFMAVVVGAAILVVIGIVAGMVVDVVGGLVVGSV